FFANLPLAAFAAWRLLRLPRGSGHRSAETRPDVPGHILFAIGAVAALYWFTSVGHRFAFASGVSALIGAIAVASLGALVCGERASPPRPAARSHGNRGRALHPVWSRLRLRHADDPGDDPDGGGARTPGRGHGAQRACALDWRRGRCRALRRSGLRADPRRGA